MNQLKGKIKFQNFVNLENAFRKVLNISKKDKSPYKIILFSPSAASFDSFKNFEDRGKYFDQLIKKFVNAN